jgi:hypothetical protein
MSEPTAKMVYDVIKILKIEPHVKMALMPV